MNIVEQAVKRAGNQTKLAAALAKLTGHPYRQGHVSHWLKTGCFPADLARVVATGIFDGEITVYEACPNIKRLVA